MVIQGYYHNIQTDEKREYGEQHLWKLHYNYEIMPIVVEDIIAKGQRHELPVLVQGTKRETTTGNKFYETNRNGAGPHHIRRHPLARGVRHGRLLQRGGSS
jgi:hypothetical protein